MNPNPARSAWDSEASEEVRDAVTKGLEAARREDLRTAYGYFLRARKAAGREKFDDLTFLLDMAGLGSGEISKWNDRLRTSKEAFRIATRRIDWLVMLYEIVFADATGIQLAQREAREKLWQDTSPAMVGESWSGISWLAGQMVLSQQTNIRKKFEGLAEQIVKQIIHKLGAIRSGETTDDVLPDALFEVERLADGLYEESEGERHAALLYGWLLALPYESWMSGARDADEISNIEDLRERFSVRLEVLQAATKS